MRNGSRLPHKSGECLLATTTPVHSAQTKAFRVEYSVFILTHPAATAHGVSPATLRVQLPLQGCSDQRRILGPRLEATLLSESLKDAAGG